MEIDVLNLRRGYINLCDRVVHTGDPVTVRGQATRELLGVTLIFNYLEEVMLPIGINRRVNLKLAAIEALSMIGCTADQDLVLRAAPHYADVLVSGMNSSAFDYASYGPRIQGQLKIVINQLKKDPTTRQALLAIWNRPDLTHDGDKPCTIMLQFFQRGNSLDCHTYMRSQDVWLGLSLDVFVFTQLMWTVAREVGCTPRQYVHHVGSFHAYERDFAAIEAMELDATPYDHNVRWPRGIVVPDSYTASFIDCARMLLNDTSTERLEGMNTWYAKQMMRVYHPDLVVS